MTMWPDGWLLCLIFLILQCWFSCKWDLIFYKGKSLNIVLGGSDNWLHNLSRVSFMQATQVKNHIISIISISKLLKPISLYMPTLKNHAVQPPNFETIGLRSNTMHIVFFFKLEDYIVFNISEGKGTIFFLEGIRRYITKNTVVYLKYRRRDEYC